VVFYKWASKYFLQSVEKVKIEKMLLFFDRFFSFLNSLCDVAKHNEAFLNHVLGDANNIWIRAGLALLELLESKQVALDQLVNNNETISCCKFKDESFIQFKHAQKYR